VAFGCTSYNDIANLNARKRLDFCWGQQKSIVI